MNKDFPLLEKMECIFSALFNLLVFLKESNFIYRIHEQLKIEVAFNFQFKKILPSLDTNYRMVKLNGKFPN